MKGKAHQCPTCIETRNEPVTCAPLRCYCNHPVCPAAESYIPTRPDNERPTT